MIAWTSKQKSKIYYKPAIFFIEVSVPSQESEWSCMFAAILPLSTIFLLDFGTVLTVWYILFYIFSTMTYDGGNLSIPIHIKQNPYKN